jgi:hypothetical protein
MTRRLLKPFWIILALLFLFEAWLWDVIQPLIAWLINRLPWQAFTVELARQVARLPAAIVVFLFIVPEIIGVPLQFFALWIVAKGAIMTGTLLFIAVKALGLALTLVLFEACKEKLMELTWFRFIHDHIMRARAWAKAQVRPLLNEITALGQRMILKLKTAIGEGGFFETLRRIRATVRRRMQP